MVLASSSHRALLFSGLGLVVVSAGVFALLDFRRVKPPAAVVPVVLAATPYMPAISDSSPRSGETWTPPVSQSRGREWVYDTFTPPQIFFNPRSKQFTVKPPAGFVEGEPEEAFGLELVAVKPEPFRLQLIGYVGDEGNWRGTFENLVTHETFLAGAGRRVPNLALYIKALEVRAQPIASGTGMTTQQRVATAVIHDEKTGRDLTLTHRERHFTSTLTAFVAVPGENGTREVRVGDSFKLGTANYRIDKITLTPATVEVTKESSTLLQPDRRVLPLRDAETAETPPPSGSQ
jgi:hypothetical protein